MTPRAGPRGGEPLRELGIRGGRAVTPLRVFVTATDTGVGKTEVACALLRLLARRGLQPAALKPYESGLRAGAMGDAERLWEAAGKRDPLEHCRVHRFRAPLAPAIAAAEEGAAPSFALVKRAVRRFDGRSLVVEGAGGLRVPLDLRRDVVDLIAELGLPSLLVARAGLGTLNHVALSLECLERRGVRTLAVVLVKSTPGADPSERTNARWLTARHRVPVLGPVGFFRDERRRAAAFERALSKLR